MGKSTRYIRAETFKEWQRPCKRKPRRQDQRMENKIIFSWWEVEESLMGGPAPCIRYNYKLLDGNFAACQKLYKCMYPLTNQLHFPKCILRK